MADDEARSLADCCSRAGAFCGEGLYAEVVRLRADNQRLTAELAKTQDASATLYGAFEDAAEARDHATAQVLIQNGETNRAATEAGLEQQRAERAEAERDALRAAVDAAEAGWKQATDAVGKLFATVARVAAWRDELARNTGGWDADVAAKLTELLAPGAALGATTTQTSDEAKPVHHAPACYPPVVDVEAWNRYVERDRLETFGPEADDPPSVVRGRE